MFNLFRRPNPQQKTVEEELTPPSQQQIVEEEIIPPQEEINPRQFVSLEQYCSQGRSFEVPLREPVKETPPQVPLRNWRDWSGDYPEEWDAKRQLDSAEDEITKRLNTAQELNLINSDLNDQAESILRDIETLSKQENDVSLLKMGIKSKLGTINSFLTKPNPLTPPPQEETPQETPPPEDEYTMYSSINN